jgi:hypothetical protein
MANLPSYGEARKGPGKIRKLKRKPKIRVSKYVTPLNLVDEREDDDKLARLARITSRKYVTDENRCRCRMDL